MKNFLAVFFGILAAAMVIWIVAFGVPEMMRDREHNLAVRRQLPLLRVRAIATACSAELLNGVTCSTLK